VYIAFDPERTVGRSRVAELISPILERIARAEPIDHAQPPAYPGKRTVERRKSNREHGMAIDEAIWTRIVSLGG